MPDAIITSTASTFGTISGTFAADQSTITGTVSGSIAGTLSGSVGVPGPQGIQGPVGPQGPQGIPGVGGAWGSIVGTLSSQTDLWTALGTKYDATNPSGFITSAALSGYATESFVTSQGYITSSALTPYLSKADNLASVASVSVARDNLGLGSLSTPTFAGVTVQGSGSNVANLTPTSLSLTHVTSGSFTIQPSVGITFPDATVQTTAYPGPPGATTWGSITGTLSSQTDLQTALDGKAPSAAGMPISGTVGQVLTKNSGTSYDASWQSFIPGDRYVTTSSTSLSVSNGTKSLTIGTGLAYTPTQDVTIALTSDPTLHHMHGPVTSYNPSTGALVVDVQNHTGSGTYSSWTVNVGGTVPLQTVEWGEILGTLGDQTDLATALNAKLEITDAASTYYLQTNPSGYITSSALTGYATESWVTSQGYETTANAAATYYPLVGNPSGFVNTTDIADMATQTWVSANFYSSSNPDGFINATTADGLYYSISNPSGFITAYQGDLSYLKQSYNLSDLTDAAVARSNLGLGTMATATASDYSTTTVANGLYYPLSSNPSSYLVAADITGKANLSGATFTGEIVTAASTTTTAGLTLPHGTAPTTPVNGEMWTTTSGLFLRVNGVTRQYVDLDGTQTINGAKTFSGANQTLGNSTTAGTINIGTGAVASGTKAINIGTGTVAPGVCTMVFGTAGVAGNTSFNGNGTFIVNNNNVQIHSNTATSTVSIGVGATVASSTKTINIGTGGVASSTTNINLGTVDGGAATVTTNALLLTRASATTGSGLRIPHGTAPTTPTNGDVWTDTAGFYARINGATVTLTPPTAATVAEAKAGTDTAKFINSNVLQKVVNSPSYYKFPRGLLTGSTSGTGASVASGALITNVIGTSTGAGWAQYKYYGLSGIDIVNATGWAVGGQSINFAKKFRITGSTNMLGALPTNTIVRVMFGKNANDGGGDPTQRCIGWRYNQATGFIEIIAHNGTTLSTLTTSSNPAAGSWFEWELYNDGAGNVQMFVNDTSIGTVTGGPVSLDFGSAPTYVEEVQCTASPSAQPQVRFRNGGLFLQP